MGIGIEIGIHIKIIFELEVYLIGCGYAELARKYSQLNLTLYLDHSNLNQNISC